MKRRGFLKTLLGAVVGGTVLSKMESVGPITAPEVMKEWQIYGTGQLASTTDNTYDIGMSRASRPRNIYLYDDSWLINTADKSNTLVEVVSADPLRLRMK